MNNMPSQMSVAEFIEETSEDFKSPTTSTFTRKMSSCRQTIGSLEESLDYDRDGLAKMRKALKTIYNGGNAHVDNELYLSKCLEKLGANAMSKDQEPDIGAAFIKFSIVTKELSALMKTLMQNLNNVLMFPLDNILKGDLRGVKGDLKKPFDKAWREYDSKMSKFEKEKKNQAKDAGISIKTSQIEVTPGEIAEEMDKEKKMFQLQMIDYLLKANEIKTKKGVELLNHLVHYYHAQTSYFQDGLKTIEHFNGYINELSTKITNIKAKQDDERNKLIDLRNVLKSSAPFLDKNGDNNYNNSSNNTGLNSTSTSGLHHNNVNNHNNDGGFHHHRTLSTKDASKGGVYNLHQLQGNKNFGCSKTGFLLKKSEGKSLRVKVWQKRKCEVKEDGFLLIHHSDETKDPTKVNLLTCQVKVIPDEKKCFDLISCNRTYHFQGEDESETEAWISVLVNCKDGALKKEFASTNITSFGNNGTKANNSGNYNNDGLTQEEVRNLSNSFHELRSSIIKQIQLLPGNDKCVDCNSTKDATWLSTNFGVIVCIECSGIHRDLGVHISRIQSLTLDNIGTSQLLIARVMSNHAFNDIMEATLRKQKPNANSSMEDRYEYIRAKYVDRKFVLRSCNGIANDLKSDLEHAITSRHLYSLLQAFGEGADLSWTLPSFAKSGETSLHVAIKNEDGTSLHIVDFLIQNSKGSTLVDSCTKDGSTPLHVAVEYNQSECIKLLLKSGANVKKVNSKGKSPLDLANELNRSNLIELLEHALKNRKTLFENVNIDWNLMTAEDASTDFSDDDVADERLTKKYFDWIASGTNSIKKKIMQTASSGSNLLSSTSSKDRSNADSKTDAVVVSSNSYAINKSPHAHHHNSHHGTHHPHGNHYGKEGGSGSVKRRKKPRKLPNTSWEHSNSVELLYLNNPLMHQQAQPQQQVVQTEERRHGMRSSRPSSVVGSESPSSLSSDSFRNREGMSLRRSSAGNNMSTAAQILFRAGGSFKKKLTPNSASKSKSAAEDSSSSAGSAAVTSAAKSGNKSTSNIYAHIRTPSDGTSIVGSSSHGVSGPVYAQINPGHRSSGHFRNRSIDLVSNNTTTPLSSMTRNSGHNNTLSSMTTNTSTTTTDNNKSMSMSSKTPPGTINGSSSISNQYNSSLQRPRFPPPPLPQHHNTPVSIRTSNNDHNLDHSAARVMYQEVIKQQEIAPKIDGQSSSQSRSILPVPVPPPRKYYFQRHDMVPVAGKMMKCRALYDCDADREDELSFKEGEVIMILSEKTEDEDWMEGFIEGNINRRGLFPISFVQMLPPS